MARLTADDMIAMVRDSVGGETSETLSDTRILRYLNQSYLELCSRFAFDQLSTSTTITTSSGTAEYELSVSGILRFTDLVDDTNNLKLYPMSENQYHEYTQGNSTSGTPVYWYVSGVGSNDRYNITFFPTPAGTYTVNVNYVKQPDEIVTSPAATSPVIPETWDDSILHRAIARAWRMLGDLEASEKWGKLAQENDYAALPSSFTPSHIPSYPGSVIGRALR